MAQQEAKIYQDEFEGIYSMIKDLQGDINNTMNEVNNHIDSLKDSLLTKTLNVSINRFDSYDNTNAETISSIDNLHDIKIENSTSKMIESVGSSLRSVLVEIRDLLGDTNKSAREVASDTEDLKKSTSEIEKSSEDTAQVSETSKALITSIVSIVSKLTTDMFNRGVDDIESMISARNDIMYTYGYTDPHQADEEFRKQWLHEAPTYQRYTAQELREMSRTAEEDALKAGYNTEASVQAVTEQLVEWRKIYGDLIDTSSELFKNTMRFVDESGESFNDIMENIQTLSTDYMVTPQLLEEVGSGYSKYLRTITSTSSAYVTSMNNLMDSVARLEDKGISAQAVLDDLDAFLYGDITSASESGMWQRFIQLGIDPYEVLTSDNPLEYFDQMEDKYKEMFQGYDLTNGQDRLMINTIAREQLKMSNDEIANLWSILKGDEEASDSNEEKIDDYTRMIEIDKERYKTEYEKSRWSYVSGQQMVQDALSYTLTENQTMVDALEAYDATAGNIVDIKTLVGTAVTILEGIAISKLTGVGSSGSGGILNFVKGLFTKGGTTAATGVGTAATTAGSTGVGGASAATGAAGAGVSGLAAGAGIATAAIGGHMVGNYLGGKLFGDEELYDEYSGVLVGPTKELWDVLKGLWYLNGFNQYKIKKESNDIITKVGSKAFDVIDYQELVPYKEQYLSGEISLSDYFKIAKNTVEDNRVYQNANEKTKNMILNSLAEDTQDLFIVKNSDQLSGLSGNKLKSNINELLEGEDFKDNDEVAKLTYKKLKSSDAIANAQSNIDTDKSKYIDYLSKHNETTSDSTIEEAQQVIDEESSYEVAESVAESKEPIVNVEVNNNEVIDVLNELIDTVKECFGRLETNDSQSIYSITPSTNLITDYT